MTARNEVRSATETSRNSAHDGMASGATYDSGAVFGNGSTGGIRIWRTRVVSALFACRMLGLALIIGSLASGCAAFRDVTELKEIQDAPGFYPKVLYYYGSTGTSHYFEQETPLADLTFLSRHYRLLKVDRREVTLPEGVEFPCFPFEERLDTPRQKMRIRITQTNPNRGVAEYVPSDTQL